MSTNRKMYAQCTVRVCVCVCVCMFCLQSFVHLQFALKFLHKKHEISFFLPVYASECGQRITVKFVLMLSKLMQSLSFCLAQRVLTEDCTTFYSSLFACLFFFIFYFVSVSPDNCMHITGIIFIIIALNVARSYTFVQLVSFS